MSSVTKEIFNSTTILKERWGILHIRNQIQSAEVLVQPTFTIPTELPISNHNSLATLITIHWTLRVIRWIRIATKAGLKKEATRYRRFIAKKRMPIENILGIFTKKSMKS